MDRAQASNARNMFGWRISCLSPTSEGRCAQLCRPDKQTDAQTRHWTRWCELAARIVSRHQHQDVLVWTGPSYATECKQHY